MPVPGEHFERDGFIVAARPQLTHVFRHVDLSHAQRKVQVRMPAAIIVNVNVREPAAELRDQLTRGVVLDRQVTVPDVEVQAELGNSFEDGCEL